MENTATEIAFPIKRIGGKSNTLPNLHVVVNTHFWKVFSSSHNTDITWQQPFQSHIINHESTNETASISQRPSVPEPNCNFPIFRARVGFQNEAAWMHGNGDWPKLVVTTRYHFSKSQSSALLCSFLDSITNRKNVTWQAQWEEGQVYDKIQLVFLSKTYLSFELDSERKFHGNNEKLATDQNWDASTF